MKLTLSVVKADIGSIVDYVCPSQQLLDTVRGYVNKHGKKLLLDSYVISSGNDIAIVMSQKLEWDAFIIGTEVVKQQAGQCGEERQQAKCEKGVLA